MIDVHKLLDKNGNFCGKKIAQHTEIIRHLKDKWHTEIAAEAVFLERGGCRAYCQQCAKVCNFIGSRYTKFCSVSCGAKFNTKYGAEHHLADRRVIAKRVDTVFKKYGVSNVQQVAHIRQKTVDTNIIKYGVKTPLQDVSKMQQAITAKYGVINVSQIPDVRERANLTMQDRFGGHVWSNAEVRRGAQLNYINKKITRLGVEPLFNVETDYNNNREKHQWKCLTCHSEFDGTIFGNVRCPTCFPRLSGTSKLEQDILAFVSQHAEAIHRDKTIISPLELDIVIPSLRIAIEVNGLYWHSELNGGDKDYHLAKSRACEAAGYRLIHIFEDEWNLKREIVQSRIMSILGIHERIYARHCTVAEISVKTKNGFLDQHHMQGADKSAVKLGLFHNNNLVCVCTFGKPRFNKKYDWELIRAASALNVTVTGGFSKLVKHFRKNYPGTIISYADKRWSTGKLYQAIGFQYVGASPPSYWYMKGYKTRLNRISFQKHKLPHCEGKSEWEIMQDLGYDRIWDCGTTKWVLE